ncbi:Soluble guanylate cyclase gcy-35 [Dirofilaria immitis]
MKSLCAPVLAIERGDGLDGRPVLLASNGCMVDSYQRDQNDLLLSQQQISVFEERKCNIYGLTYLDKRDILFAHGEKLIAIIRQFSSIPQKQVFTFKDWIQALYVFNKQKESEHSLELVTLSINNAVQLFRLNIFGGSSGVNIKEVTTVKSDYRAVITHSLLDGDSWNTLRTVVGTVIGDIIISFPSKSSSPFHVLKHHTGMIFGLLIKCNFLFSISDDRSLHMWSLDRACHINECYGHSTRPFSICNGPENIIFTGSQDGSICMWLIGESFVSLLKLIHTRYGVIRSFLFISQELFFGTGCGFFGSITFPENIENMQTIDIIYPNLSVQSFVTLSQQFYYLLDSQGALYEANTISLNKILQCSSVRSNSLKLSLCRKYIAFSEDKKLHVIRVKDRKCASFCALDQILDLFWIRNCLFLVLLNFKNMIVHFSEDMSGWANYIVQIDLKEIVSCAVYAEELFLGTDKGSIIVVHNFEMKQIIKRAHGRNGVADVKLHKAKLLSIGRDGKLCIWERDSALQLLSASKLFTAVEMEWPCRFLETRDQLYVAGFRGGNFVVVNYNSGHCVCDVWCGGRRRSWCLSVLEGNENCGKSNSLCFQFVMKRRISKIMLQMNDLHIIKPNLHLSNITSITVARSNQNELYVSGGIDTALVLFRLANSGSIEVKQRLQAHSSSVYCVCAMNTYLISAGGKSEIFIWRLEAGNLRQLFNTRMEESYRLLSVQFMSVNPHIRFLVSRSDGRLMIYEISQTLDLKKHSVLSESFGGNGIMIKISCASFDDGFVCVAISSIGILHIWSFSELIDLKDHRTIEVEKCGLSALSIYIENEFLYIGVGSESGTISIFQVEKNWKFTKSINCWHSATCADLHLHRTSQSFLVFSVALDCRLAVFIYSPDFQTLNFQQSVLLNVADPSSLIVSTISNNVMKNEISEIGWFHECFRMMIFEQYGRDVWLKILNSCHLKEGEECVVTCYYDDEITMEVARAISHVLHLPLDAIWEAFGVYFVHFVMKNGWDELLQVLAYNLKGFLNNLDTVHHFADHIVFSMKLRGPLFRCEFDSDGSLLLHYYSSRTGFPGIVKGIVREISRRIFGIEVGITIKSRIREHISSIIKEHITFSITGKDENKGSPNCLNCMSPPLMNLLKNTEPNEHCGLSLSEFAIIFPYHICFNNEFRILHHGAFIKKYAPSVKCGVTLLNDIAQLIYPNVPFIYKSLLAFINSIFVLTLRDTIDNEFRSQSVVLKGSMTLLSNGHFIYMCSLDVSEIIHLNQRELYINDMQLHDATRNIVMVNQLRLHQIKHTEKLKETKNNLRKLNEKMAAEKDRSEKLLYELIPPLVAEILRTGEYAEATLLFSDIVTFTNICAACTPYDVFNMLNDLYTKFDRIVKINDVYKVETIGDAYVVASGVPTQCIDHAERILNMAVGMQMEVKSVMRPETNIPLEIRIGIHTGPVFAGVVGIKMPRYCLLGKTVSVARKLESDGVPQRIRVSETAKNSALQTNKFLEFTDGGVIEVKGVGRMHTYFLEKNIQKTIWDTCDGAKQPRQSTDGYFGLYEARSTSFKKEIPCEIAILDKEKQKVAQNPSPLPSVLRPIGTDFQGSNICGIT